MVTYARQPRKNDFGRNHVHFASIGRHRVVAYRIASEFRFRLAHFGGVYDASNFFDGFVRSPIVPMTEAFHVLGHLPTLSNTGPWSPCPSNCTPSFRRKSLSNFLPNPKEPLQCIVVHRVQDCLVRFGAEAPTVWLAL